MNVVYVVSSVDIDCIAIFRTEDEAARFVDGANTGSPGTFTWVEYLLDSYRVDRKEDAEA